MREQGIWDDDKEEKYNHFIEDIANREKILEGGGIPLKKARKTALELRELRTEFRSLIAERSSLRQAETNPLQPPDRIQDLGELYPTQYQ